MNVMYVEKARLVSLFDTRLINPKGLDLSPLLKHLTDEFSFSKHPAHPQDFQDNALVFESGAFVNGGEQRLAANLKTYADGIITETSSSTNDTVEFTIQVLTSIEDFGFYLPKDVMENLGFVSQLIFSSEKRLIQLNPKLSKVSDFLNTRFKGMEGKSREFDFGGIQFWSADHAKPLAPIPFRIERKEGTSPESNIYFSQAPLETDDHIELLNMVEDILSA